MWEYIKIGLFMFMCITIIIQFIVALLKFYDWVMYDTPNDLVFGLAMLYSMSITIPILIWLGHLLRII